MQKYQGASLSVLSSTQQQSNSSDKTKCLHTLIALTPQMTGLSLVGPCAVYGLVGDAMVHLEFHLGTSKHMVLPTAASYCRCSDTLPQNGTTGLPRSITLKKGEVEGTVVSLAAPTPSIILFVVTWKMDIAEYV